MRYYIHRLKYGYLIMHGFSFQNMLSEDMNYSSAIFLDYKEDLMKAPELCETLEAAQLRKMK